jgi:hypothetical protein
LIQEEQHELQKRYGTDKCLLDLSEEFADSNTALHIGAARGLTDVIVWLIEETGAKVNCTNAELETPLLLAMKNRKSNAAQCLLLHGADWTMVSRVKLSVLQLVALWGQSTVLDSISNSQPASLKEVVLHLAHPGELSPEHLDVCLQDNQSLVFDTELMTQMQWILQYVPIGALQALVPLHVLY